MLRTMDKNVLAYAAGRELIRFVGGANRVENIVMRIISDTKHISMDCHSSLLSRTNCLIKPHGMMVIKLTA